MRSIILGLVIVVLFQISCTTDDEINWQENVDPMLVSYFDLFAEEGGIRGVQVEYGERMISASFESLENDITGQCASSADGRRDIRLDRAFWENAREMEREFLIFHELGHCYLGRPHLDEASNDGSCTSIMNSGLGDCRSNYGLGNRDDYLDELFAE